MTPIKEIELLADIFRRQIRENATICARYAKYTGLDDFEVARRKYLSEIRGRPDYQKMQEARNGIIDDCAEKFGMERWWAEAFLGIDLDRELSKEFDRAWKEASCETGD